MGFRVVFMGTPAFSVPALEALIASQHDVIAVYTQPPRRAGRGKDVTRTPVHRTADKHAIPVHHPTSLKSGEAQTAFASHNADVACVIAYGLLLPQPILDAPLHGCLNVHASLLPRWRGAAPINRAIMAGDEETGLMVMRMEAGLDTGPFSLAARTPIEPTMTAGDLHDTLSEQGARLLIQALDTLQSGTLSFTAQDEVGVTYAHKIDKAEARIDWSLEAAEVDRLIRGLSPFPGAWTTFDGQRVKLLRSRLSDNAAMPDAPPGTVLLDRGEVVCGTGTIALLEVQRAGGKVLPFVEFANGVSMDAPLRFE